MYNIIFAHGWGFDSSFFDNLLFHFQKNLNCCAVNFHFLDSYYFKIPKNQDLNLKLNQYIESKNESINIGIGHCLGFAKLLNLDIKFDKIIGISCFNRFSESKLSQKRLQRTIEAFHQDPVNVLNNFRNMCIHDNTKMAREDLNFDILFNDLKMLEKIDLTSKISTIKYPILSIASMEDKILDTIHNFKNLDNIEIMTEENNHFGHGIGYLGADYCFKKINKFIQL